MFPCTSLVYSLDTLCSFLIYILFFTDKKKIIIGIPARNIGSDMAQDGSPSLFCISKFSA